LALRRRIGATGPSDAAQQVLNIARVVAAALQ
jgi:hypothetical protein